MKRIPWPVALVLLIVAIGLVYYRVASSTSPVVSNSSRAPAAPPGSGPTPEQLRKWAAGAEAAEKRRLADLERFGKKKAAKDASPAKATKGGE
jgi:hypothetical protein